MKQSFILAAFAAAISAMPAQAQPVAADLLPAYEVSTIVTSMGMRPIGRPAWMRGRYVIAAVDRYGREVNVVLDARDGQVLAVQPLARNSFGAPPPHPGYGPRPGPYDPMDGRAAPPGPAPYDDEYFDNDQQQGSLPPRAPARVAAPSHAPAATGSVTRSVPAERKAAAAKPQTPMPRPRPALARANDPSNAATDKPPAAGKPQPATTAGIEAKPDATKPGVRVIDLSKPKDAAKPEDKPGEVIRF